MRRSGFSICEVLGDSVLKLSSSELALEPAELVSDDERKTSAASDVVGKAVEMGVVGGNEEVEIESARYKVVASKPVGEPVWEDDDDDSLLCQAMGV